MGADKVVRLKVQVRPGVVCDASITLPDYPADATPVAWDKLPEATVKQIADYMAQIKARKAAEPGKTIPPRHWR